jgi:hypothetical protein
MQTELPKQFSNLFGSAAARANAPDPEPEVLADVVEESAQEDRVGEPVPDVRRTPTPRKPRKVRQRYRELKLVLPEVVVRELKKHAGGTLTTCSEVVLMALRSHLTAVREVLKKSA